MLLLARFEPCTIVGPNSPGEMIWGRGETISVSDFIESVVHKWCCCCCCCCWWWWWWWLCVCVYSVVVVTMEFVVKFNFFQMVSCLFQWWSSVFLLSIKFRIEPGKFSSSMHTFIYIQEDGNKQKQTEYLCTLLRLSIALQKLLQHCTADSQKSHSTFVSTQTSAASVLLLVPSLVFSCLILSFG